MSELFVQFRGLWNNVEWYIVKLIVVAFIVYVSAYHIGKFWANFTR